MEGKSSMKEHNAIDGSRLRHIEKARVHFLLFNVQSTQSLHNTYNQTSRDMVSPRQVLHVPCMS